MKGHIAYVMRRFDLELFLKYTEQYSITELFVVPPIIVSILQSPLTQKFTLKSLRCGMTGGAKIDLLSQKRFTELMHADGCLNPCYGMTELSCIGACYSWPEQDVDGSIGFFLPNLEVKYVMRQSLTALKVTSYRLVDEAGLEVRAFNARGELWIRGPTVIQGYYENPEANASAFTEGWFHTGDIAYCEAMSKKWYIVDRKKELIKVRGFQVAPPEIEAALMSHPAILDATVIGVPAANPVDGESPRAYIIRSTTVRPTLTEGDVHSFVSARLAGYKQLKGGVVFVGELPKTASGKYLKRYLREAYKQELDLSRSAKL